MGNCNQGGPKEPFIKGKSKKGKKIEVPADDNFDNLEKVHALVVFCDYGFEPAKSLGWVAPGFGEKLDTAENAEMMVKILEDTGVDSISRLSNLQATKEAVLAEIKRVGELCDENDTFFFFYSGHGNPMPDQDGDEEDGSDEAMCLPFADGSCNEGSWLRDDDFSLQVSEVTAGHKLIILDCCHSGSMLDFKKPIWQDQSAISIVGCKDMEESAAMGGGTRGGAFTKSVNAAVRSGNSSQTNLVSVGHIFNCICKYSEEFIPAGHTQHITINCSPGIGPDMMAWPLNMPDEAVA
jgi:hypothetical protein